MYEPCHSLNFAKTLLAQSLKDFVDNRKAQPEVLAQVNERLFPFKQRIFRASSSSKLEGMFVFITDCGDGIAGTIGFRHRDKAGLVS